MPREIGRCLFQPSRHPRLQRVPRLSPQALAHAMSTEPKREGKGRMQASRFSCCAASSQLTQAYHLASFFLIRQKGCPSHLNVKTCSCRSYVSVCADAVSPDDKHYVLADGTVAHNAKLPP